MKRPRLAGTAARLLIASALLFLPPAAFAISRAELDKVIDFSVTVKTLERLDAATARDYRLDERFVVLDGTVGTIEVLDPEESRYQVVVELISGEWIGLEEVRSYRCLVLFSGPEFARVFPRRAPRDAGPQVIAANDRVLFVARLLEPVALDEGSSIWVLQGVYARALP
ncbi:MAG: hypothetical protein JW820_09520 [Spirochaetales bacterium]|nr:hypothetical protein [Spirochaetales bacterium]